MVILATRAIDKRCHIEFWFWEYQPECVSTGFFTPGTGANALRLIRKSSVAVA